MLLPRGEFTADMKNAKPKKVAPRSATAVDAYIGARIRERRHDLEMSQHALAKTLASLFSKFRSTKTARTASAPRGCSKYARL
jgi:hypothetical protein